MAKAKAKEVERRAAAARIAAVVAAKLTHEYFVRGVEVDIKADESPVTIADRQAEDFLRSRFRKEFPGDGFLGEEFGDEPSSTGFRWIIDPIDGTRNFVRGVPIYATLVGLEFEGKLVAGFVAEPCLDRLFHAVRGGGAFCDDKPLAVSKVKTLAEALMIYTSVDWFEKANQTDAFMRLVRSVDRSRGFGDYFGFLLVAQGVAEFVLEPKIAPWDIAALAPIVEEAGGIFTDWHGKPTIYGQGAIAGNPPIHAAVMKSLHPKRP